jgi:hemolysin III
VYHGEKFNSVTHLVGSALSIAGLSILVTLAAQQGDPWKVLSFSIYGVTLVMLYCFSTIFHSIRSPRAKAILQKLDHNAIYLLIAGSYTPIALITLRGPWGWTLFGLSWCLALFGIIQELTLGRHTRRLSMILYVLMGWLVLIAIKPLTQAMPPGGMGWLVAGGIVYSAAFIFTSTTPRSGITTASGTCLCWVAACATSCVSCCTWPEHCKVSGCQHPNLKQAAGFGRGIAAIGSPLRSSA